MNPITAIVIEDITLISISVIELKYNQVIDVIRFFSITKEKERTKKKSIEVIVIL
jgi:hypothetical protein